MRSSEIKKRIRLVTMYLEILLAGFIIIAVVIGTVDLIRYLGIIYKTNPIDTYTVFSKFLGHVLLLVVGVELSAMLILHTPGSVIEVLLFAIARKMLIGSQNMIDSLLGIVAIAAIFAIGKYLIANNKASEQEGVIFMPNAPISYVNEAVGVTLTAEPGHNLADLIDYLSKHTFIEPSEGAEFCTGDAKLKILRTNEDKIEKILVTKIDNFIRYGGFLSGSNIRINKGV